MPTLGRCTIPELDRNGYIGVMFKPVSGRTTTSSERTRSGQRGVAQDGKRPAHAAGPVGRTDDYGVVASCTRATVPALWEYRSMTRAPASLSTVNTCSRPSIRHSPSRTRSVSGRRPIASPISTGSKLQCASSLGALLVALSLAAPAFAFPPYRTTDAETAGDDTLETRIGLLRLQVNDSHSTRKTPLSRINYGIGPHFEVISELEYAIDERELDEGALGFKWAKLENRRGFGVETLLLLPVRSELHGVGIESQVIRTWQQERSRVHVNAGAFYDPRGTDTERGWRASALAEFPRDRLRPGVELFVRDSNTTEMRMQAGVGLIASLEPAERARVLEQARAIAGAGTVTVPYRTEVLVCLRTTRPASTG